MATAAKTNAVDLTTFLAALRDLIDAHLGDGATAAPAAPVAARKAPARPATKQVEVEADEVEEEDEDPQAARRAELKKMSVAALRKAALGRGFAKDDVADASVEDLVTSILADEADEASEAPDEDEVEETDEENETNEDEAAEDEADETDEEEGYDKATLEAMTLRELKRVAKEEYQVDAADLVGLDKDGVVALLLGDEEEDEVADDEEDEGGYTEDDLNNMSPAELRSLAKEYGVTIKPGAAKSAIITAILNAA